MPKTARYPGANVTARYWPNGGGILQSKLDKLVLHSTETTGLPSYSSGKTAPNLTVNPWPGRQGVWQHFRSVAMSAKALRDTGGFAENRDLVSQVEIIGYSDPAKRSSGYFLPNLPPEGIEYLAEVLAWYSREWGIPLRRPAAWPTYPASYGTRNGARMSTAVFDAFSGVLGHLHVPDSVHGDPTLNIDALLAAAAVKLTPPTLGQRVLSKDGTDTGPDVGQLIDALRAHGYSLTNDATFGPSVDAAVRDFQKKAGLTVDGIVGPQTVARLVAPDPAPVPEPTPEPAPPKTVDVTFKVATFNCLDPGIRQGNPPKLHPFTAKREAAIVKAVKAAGPADFLCATECPQVISDAILDDLPSGYKVWEAGSQRIIFNAAIWDYSEGPDSDKWGYHGYVVATFTHRKTGLKVTIGVYHLPPNSTTSEARQRANLAEVLAEMRRHGGIRIIGGDGMDSASWAGGWIDARTAGKWEDRNKPTYQGESITDRVQLDAKTPARIDDYELLSGGVGTDHALAVAQFTATLPAPASSL